MLNQAFFKQVAAATVAGLLVWYFTKPKTSTVSATSTEA